MPNTAITIAAANTTAIPSPSAVGPALTGWLDFNALVMELRRRMGGRSDLDFTDIELHINEAYLDLCSMLDFDYLQTSVSWTTVAEQGLYLLPRHVREVISLSSQGPEGSFAPYPLEKIDLATYRNLPDATYMSDRLSRQFFVTGQNILVIHEVPDVEYLMTAQLKLRPARMTLSDHHPVLPEEWQEGLLLLAQAKAHDSLLEFELGAQRTNQYLAFVRSRRNERAERNEGSIGRLYMPQSAADLRRGNRRGY